MGLISTLRQSLLIGKLARVPTWEPSRVLTLQQQRFQTLLINTLAQSLYYRKKYGGIRTVLPGLHDLPPITKQEMLDNFDELVTDTNIRYEKITSFLDDEANLGHWFLGNYAVSHTSGSQGRSLPIVQERKTLRLLFALLSARANARGRPGILEGIRRLRQPARVAIVAVRRGFYPSASAFEFMSEICGPFVRIEWFSAMDPTLHEQLEDFQPNMLVGYASVLESLALQTNRFRLKHLEQISNSSEQLCERARQRIVQAFQVPILDHYGAGECLFLSEGCPTNGGAHINTDWVILENVDEKNRPVPTGIAGAKVLVTNLANQVQPFIRYEIPDSIVMTSKPCQCGSQLPRIERVEGRAAELFWVPKDYGHQLINGALFHVVADSFREIREWQAIQHAEDHIELLVERIPSNGAQSQDFQSLFIDQLHRAGIPLTVTISVKFVDRLLPDAKSGKFRRLIRHIPEPAQFQTRALA